MKLTLAQNIVPAIKKHRGLEQYPDWKQSEKTAMKHARVSFMI